LTDAGDVPNAEYDSPADPGSADDGGVVP
jgi:hypothetical protein